MLVAYRIPETSYSFPCVFRHGSVKIVHFIFLKFIISQSTHPLSSEILLCRVHKTAFHQFRMRSHSRYFSVFKHYYVVRVYYRAYPLGYYQNSSVLQLCFKRISESRVGFEIQCRKTVVKYIQIRFFS